jgi:two-component system chemotaxis sensor kinase CheA
MTIELSEFYQTFFEEAAEHLAAMETLLLGMDIEAPDLDDLNAIFRSAHSIKGGSGMFGFSEMTEVTHILETLLDRLRKQELRLTERMVDAFLQAADILKAQIESRQNGIPFEQSAVDGICAVLAQLADDSAPPSSDSSTSPTAYDICFSRQGTPLAEPAPFDWLLDSLAGLGQLEIIDQGEQPGKPARLKLFQPTSLEDIKEAFAFFVQPEQVTIAPVSPEAPAAGAVPGASTTPEQMEAASEEEQGYGFFTELKQAEPGTAQTHPAVAPLHPGQSDSSRAPARAPESATGDRPSQKAVGASQPDSSIRVNIEKVDQLINLVGELVITQAMLAQTASEVDPVLHENLLNGIALLERNTRDLQEAVMSIRMMPMSFVFSRFPRMVRDIAGKLGKEINFRTQGEGTELDKGLIEKITDPLTHLVRNSLDHGVEAPVMRLQKGKDPKGTLILRAFHQGGNVVIEVQDDGAGLNREKILAKARERGIPVSDSMTDQEVWLLIFAPGFSTADAVTDVSGRGVGMDVVKRNIESLGGRVEIESFRDIGTKITIRLPLTLAILDGLSIAVGKEVFIIPITSIVESLQPAPGDVRPVAGRGRVVHVRGEYLPLIALHDVFAVPPRSYDPHHGTLMIVEADGIKAALLVDELLGQHQVVIKSLETNYRRVPGISGATIMGNGRVALILDANAVVRIGKTLPATLAPPGHEGLSDWELVETVDTPRESAPISATETGDVSMRLTDAVAAHMKWRTRLRLLLDGQGEHLSADAVALDHVCDLGKWIYGDGKRYAHLPAFGELRGAHTRFHRCAGDVVIQHMQGNKCGAERMLGTGGAFAEASTETVKAIMKLQKTLERQCRAG